MQAQDKVVQYLYETHALEAALVQTLTAHIAITPRGDYRRLLERHLDETQAQAQRIQERLGALGESKNPVAVAYGLLQTAAGQLISLGKAPLDLVRGTSGEEKLLKNAKDEAASEALEIATYDSLEALANEVGDAKTATLAREHRTQEEVFLKDLREQIGVLTKAVVAADVEGEVSYDPSTTGAADAVRSASRTAKRTASKAKAGAKETTGEAKAAGRAAASDAKGATKRSASKAEKAVASRVEKAEDTVEGAADRVAAAAKDTARRVPGEAEVEGEVKGTRAGESDLPIANYDSLTVEQLLPKLKLLPTQQLATVDGYEREHRARKRVLDRIRQLRERETATAQR